MADVQTLSFSWAIMKLTCDYCGAYGLHSIDTRRSHGKRLVGSLSHHGWGYTKRGHLLCSTCSIRVAAWEGKLCGRAALYRARRKWGKRK